MNESPAERLRRRNAMRESALEAAASLGALREPARPTTSQRRRRGLALEQGLLLSLAEQDGVWRLREASAAGAAGSADGGGLGRARTLRAGRRAERRAGDAEGLDTSELIPLERLAPDRLRGALISVDGKLTPHQGLRPFIAASRSFGQPMARAPQVPAGGRVLLLVHGTFSRGEAFLEGLGRAPNGQDFFELLGKRYDAIYSFDHPTLTVDPAFNARELSLALADCNAPVDVVCHSRGGLVTRWWAEAMDKGSARPDRMVFVGSPLAGTGLAAAPNIGRTLDLLANFAAGLGFVGAGVPFLQTAVGLFQAFASVGRLVGRTPIPDALVGLVPGLRAMSRGSNNSELELLRSGAGDPGTRRFFIRSNFESEEVGWQFWKVFRNPLQRLGDAATDVIFDGPNDLVVDTSSMTDWAGAAHRVPLSNLYDFKTGSTVHHTNYFEQKETVEHLVRWLGN
ncbi:MAG TPA: hypothetical protein VLC09_11410 [Polyangiaceae bacterium]|nr:hypothetical protein [Polyangiaceae bacterium]